MSNVLLEEGATLDDQTTSTMGQQFRWVNQRRERRGGREREREEGGRGGEGEREMREGGKGERREKGKVGGEG